MYKKITIYGIIPFLYIFCGSYLLAHPQGHALSKVQLLALIAGEVFPENVVHDLQSRGVSFVSDENFESLAATAGADAKLLSALRAATRNPATSSESLAEQALLQHLSYAGSLVRSGDAQAAAKELSNSLLNPNGKSAAGFVMGEILIRDRHFAEAAAIYSRILQDDPDFPEVHSRLSLALTENDGDDGFREAKLALQENPNDAVAHRSAGIALRSQQNFPAAKLEFEASIRNKPDYDLAYGSLGIVLNQLQDYAGAAAQYKKAITLNPKNINARYNLGVVYTEQGDHISAIRAYREAKLLDPSRLDVRQNLGAELIETDSAAAITEFQELIALAPNYSICHFCLGNAYYNVGRIPEAQKQFQIAADADPTDALPHRGLGLIFEAQKNYDAALTEYRKAQALDPSSNINFVRAGRMFLLKKDFSAATSELKQAEQIGPTDWEPHSLHGQALEGTGDRAAAIAEYQEALSLAPKQLQPRMDLALAQEKSGDWVAALGNYRQAALDEGSPKPGSTSFLNYDAQNKYKSAQERFQSRIAELRSSGHAADASALEASWKSSKSATNLDAEYHDAIQASMSAMQQRQFDTAETAAKHAIAIAEKIQPQDGRLPESVGQLANVYAWRQDFKNAGETYKRQLVVSEKIYGAQSPMLSTALQNLGMLALQQKDFANAETSFTRSYDLQLKTYGENSQGVADSLRGLAHVYQMQQDFPKAESASLHALKIYETIYGPDSQQAAMPWSSLCSLYDRSGKPEKSAPCHAHLVALAEKLYGPDSPYLVQDLTAEARALRQLGRNDEAAKLEARLQSLQRSQSAQMPVPPPGQP